jgi:Dyp-type peroxidase family
VLFHIEGDNKFLVVDLWDALRAVVVRHGARVAGIRHGFNRGDQRDHTGFHDGVANLQDTLKQDPHEYRQQIYLPHPAPAFPGEPTTARDDPRYDGGTYMVVRSYIEHLDRWNAKNFEVTDFFGKKFHDEDARRHAIGRDRETGCVISRANGAHLVRERDSTETNLGYNESHVLKARGGTIAPFSGPFPPVAKGNYNVFSTQNIRIRRRGTNFADIDPTTGAVTYGLHFICFQNNIQQTGFEFINNIWLMNPMFRRSKDGLFDPDNGIIEPIEGAYFFLPAEHRAFPGDVFWD